MSSIQNQSSNMYWHILVDDADDYTATVKR